MEGPSLVIFKEELSRFVGREVLEVTGNSSIDIKSLEGRRLEDIWTWGKQGFLHFGHDLWLRVHFLLWGSYRVDEEKEGRTPRLALHFGDGVVYFYACSLHLAEGFPHELYDWRVDLMSSEWDASHVKELLLRKPNEWVCDALLNQDIFAGSGNIIKNEVLYLERLHPLARVDDLSSSALDSLILREREYSWNFYRWKKEFVLRKNWQIFRKRVCPSCGQKPNVERMGKSDRVTFYCPRCQRLPVRRPLAPAQPARWLENTAHES